MICLTQNGKLILSIFVICFLVPIIGPSNVWGESASNNIRRGCVRFVHRNDILIPDWNGGASKRETKKICNGKDEAYIYEADQFVKCKLIEYPEPREAFGADNISYSINLAPLPSKLRGENEWFNVCASAAQKIEKFKVAKISDIQKKEITSFLLASPHKFKVAKAPKIQDEQTHYGWTLFTSPKGKSVVFVGVENEEFDPATAGDLGPYRETPVAVVQKPNAKPFVVIVPGGASHVVDVDGNGNPEAVLDASGPDSSGTWLVELDDLQTEKLPNGRLNLKAPPYQDDTNFCLHPIWDAVEKWSEEKKLELVIQRDETFKEVADGLYTMTVQAISKEYSSINLEIKTKGSKDVEGCSVAGVKELSRNRLPLK